MRRGTLTLLLFIILLAMGASYVVFWPNSGKDGKPWHGISNPFTIKQGLDLQGGVSVLLVPAPGQNPTDADMENTRTQIEQRVNSGLGVNEPSIRTTNYGWNQPSILVELPGLTGGNQQAAIDTLGKTGKLEFWDTGSTSVPEGTTLNPNDPTYASTIVKGQPLFTGGDLDPQSLP